MARIRAVPLALDEDLERIAAPQQFLAGRSGAGGYTLRRQTSIPTCCVATVVVTTDSEPEAQELAPNMLALIHAYAVALGDGGRSDPRTSISVLPADRAERAEGLPHSLVGELETPARPHNAESREGSVGRHSAWRSGIQLGALRLARGRRGGFFDGIQWSPLHVIRGDAVLEAQVALQVLPFRPRQRAVVDQDFSAMSLGKGQSLAGTFCPIVRPVVPAAPVSLGAPPPTAPSR